MHAKINRKKTEQIDIEEICMQILKPQVPLALRLSGILMGGVVLVFHRKVKFLQASAMTRQVGVQSLTQFFMLKQLKIKTVMYKKSNDNVISLPKGKSHGKQENLTIDYDFDAFDDIERPMMRPSTPEQRSSDRDTFRSKEYIVVTKPGKHTPRQVCGADVGLDENLYLGPDHLTADSRDITLDDNNHSSNGQFGDFGMDILEERLPVNDHDPMDLDTFFAEIRLSEEIKDPLSADLQANSAGQEEQQSEQQDPRTDLQTSPLKGEELFGPESAEQQEASAAAPPVQKKRKRQVRRKLKSVLDESLEISAPVFATWLRDREDIVGREKARKTDSDVARMAQMLFQLPSSSLSHWTRTPELEPDWTDCLVDLWNAEIGVNSKGDRNCQNQIARQASPQVLDTSVQGNHTDTKSHSDPSDNQPDGEFNLICSSETLANVEPAVGNLHDVPTDDGGNPRARDALDSVERFRSGHSDMRDYGSVEKLRGVLPSPSSGSEDHFGGSQLGLTPSLSGPFGSNAGGRPNRLLSTPGSGKLPFDVEVEPLDTGGSGRLANARLSSPAIRLGDFPADNYFTGTDIPAAPDALGSSDYLNKLRGTLRGALTQFNRLEETAVSAQGSGKKDDCLKNVSVTVLQCLRQNFNELGARCKEYQSLDILAQGMDRSEAAKLFYHTLVLTSNNYLNVSQDKSYGDILISRGPNI
ncbi:unnamed protein product [Calypogeia fissa]